ncbi:MAG: 4-alpha-glucanotransferase, partial [Coriobacteriales bacterium]|nr:4-alpha-glucanotransferase [Coriobacteriales bacterium]
MTKRSAGILHAMSTLGGESYEFIDFLAEAGQSFWQILPIGPVGKSLSPYQSSSAFAGNPAFINREALRHDASRYAPKGARYAKFLEENAAWIHNYALFVAVRASQGKNPLPLWPDTLRNPSSAKLAELRASHKSEIEAVLHEQYCFFEQWHELKRYAQKKGIGIIGDLPIYVCEDSAEFWLNRDYFDVDKEGRPASTAGVPPDAFSETGQRWNTPVYAWGNNQKGIFDFWRDRLAQAARLYDGVRIDHFRAFADFYAIDMQTEGALQAEGALLTKGDVPCVLLTKGDVPSVLLAGDQPTR